MRILVADDAAELRTWLRLGLQRLGAVVVEAADGRQCLDLLIGAGSFDLVVSDMRMPFLSGLSVLVSARLRKITTPFILITAFSDWDLRRRVTAFAAAAVVDKPFELEELVSCARTLKNGISSDDGERMAASPHTGETDRPS